MMIKRRLRPKKKLIITVSIDREILDEIDKIKKENKLYERVPKSALVEELLRIGLKHLDEYLKKGEISVTK
jgi:metal-responsive CopG/Arc/MetJ family transcriptional regulator